MDMYVVWWMLLIILHFTYEYTNHAHMWCLYMLGAPWSFTLQSKCTLKTRAIVRYFFFFVSLLASYKLQISYIRMLSWVYNCVCVRERLDAVELINVRSIIIHFAAQNLTYYNQTRDCFVIYCSQVSHTPHNAHFMLSANSIPAFVVFRGAA